MESDPPADAVGESLPPVTQAAATPVSLRKRLLKPHTIISFVMAFAILFFVVERLDINVGETLRNIRAANPLFLIAAFVLYYLSFPMRAVRWRRLLSNVGFHSDRSVRLPGVPGLAEIIFLSWFANCVVPAKLGDAYRGYLLRRSAGTSLPKAIGTVVAERILDMLILFTLLVVSGWLAFRGHIQGAVANLFLVGLAFIVLLIIGLLAMRYLDHHIRRLVPRRLVGAYGRFVQGTLHSFRALPLLVGYTVVVWALESSRLYFVTSAVHLKLALPAVIFTALASSLLTTLPITPAGLGVVESGIITVLLLLSVDKGVAGSVAVLDRLISYWSFIVLGIIVFVVSKKK